MDKYDRHAGIIHGYYKGKVKHYEDTTWRPEDHHWAETFGVIAFISFWPVVFASIAIWWLIN